VYFRVLAAGLLLLAEVEDHTFRAAPFLDGEAAWDV
jgi:hypothetical protein